MEELWITITDKIHKAFTEKSSRLIFPRHSHRHIASVAEATRTLQMLRMAIRMEKMITQLFPYKESCRDPVVHPTMCNWGL